MDPTAPNSDSGTGKDQEGDKKNMASSSADAPPTKKDDDTTNDDTTNENNEDPTTTTSDERISHESFETWIDEQLKATNPAVARKYAHLFLTNDDGDNDSKKNNNNNNSIPACITHWRRRFSGNPSLWKRLFSKERVCKEVIEALPIVDGVVRFVLNRQEQLLQSESSASQNESHNDNNNGEHDTQQQQQLPQEQQPKQRRRDAIVVDLCSGKGYLSMLLSEMLSRKLQEQRAQYQDKGADNSNNNNNNNNDNVDSETGLNIRKFILIDKQWPLHGSDQQLNNIDTSSSQHINWEHIYGTCPTTGQSYETTWPIPLQTTKQNLKAGRTARVLKERLFDAHHENKQEPPPIFIVLAVHLCGTLSLKAVEMFNDQANEVQWLALKPCCLPPPIFIKQKHVFTLGRNHCFDARDVCSGGRWKNNIWKGPPRHLLPAKFQVWCRNLYEGIDIWKDGDGGENDNGPDKNGKNHNNEDGDDDHDEIQASKKSKNDDDNNNNNNHHGDKCQVEVLVQADGGYQNSFLFAERGRPGQTTLAPLVAATGQPQP